MPKGPGTSSTTGYLYMRLVTEDGKTLGWQKAKDYQDKWCLTCGGRGKAPCPQQDCDGGTVWRMQRQTFVNPVTKARQVQNVPVQVPCPKCKGQGWVPCPDCKEGKDRALKDLPN